MALTQLPLGVLVGVGALLLLILRSVFNALRSPLTSVPGPWHTRFTKWPLKLAVLTGRRIHHVDALHRAYGPIVRIAPDEVAVADLEAFSQIHRIGGGFNKSAWYNENGTRIPGGAVEPGIFNMRDPKQHAQRRRLFARPFSNSALRGSWEDAVRATVERAVARIRAEAAGGGDADVLKWWTLMTTDVIAHLAFGDSFDMVGFGRTNDYIDGLQNALLASGLRGELPWIEAVLRVVPLPSVRRILQSDQVVFDHGARAVSNLRQVGGSQNLFGQMLAQSDSQEKQDDLSDLSVRLEASNFIVAGSDTTAVTLTYLVWAVLKRPDLQQRLEEEVGKLPSDFTDEDLEKLPLLNSVIEETLRLYGAAPGALPRVVPEGGATLAGHYLPAKTVVTTQAFTLHRDPAIFPDPEKFDETRFAQPQTAAQKAAFHPFGVGSRVCLGIHLARMELRLAAALFFRKCRGARLGSNMDDKVMEMENHFLIAPRGHHCNITLG
ncbi:cytochrome P450 [Pestalotiopsis sp. NC0098]|nr:cytochrome P450 [Pestalotiopsis sp. NC0098]